VGPEHLAREVRRWIDRLDFSSVEKGYSSLGRHGYEPRHVVGVLIYASLIGMHHSTKIARALQTDGAFRFLSGGHAISGPTLRRFRVRNTAFFRAALEQTVALAAEMKLIAPMELAIDSMRIRAYASAGAVRTVERSKRRLTELARVDVATLTEAQRERHEAKVEKHRSAIEACEQQLRASLVLTNPLAAMMKFPESGGLPGHRVTVTSSGVKSRIALTVLIDADNQDWGKAGPVLLEARRVLEKAGVVGPMQAAADAGFWSPADLNFAANNRDWVDLLVNEPKTPQHGRGLFTTDDFDHRSDGTVICPAGRKMRGPINSGSRGVRYHRWAGVECSSCELKPRCTTAPTRFYTIQPSYHPLRMAMRARMAQPDAQRRYGLRMAIVEPVFSSIAAVMGYRRATTRHPDGVVGEILLKILAHNVSRLVQARRLLSVHVLWDLF